jgi:hypothetical protein
VLGTPDIPVKNGVTRILYKSGSMYEGEVKDGKRCVYACVYVSMYLCIVYQSGSIYEGEVKDGKRCVCLCKCINLCMYLCIVRLSV